jgi:putative ABC transport system substrate-binding protein
MKLLMQRRNFIAIFAGAAAAWPLAARAQQSDRVRRVAVLALGDELSSGALRDELKKLGWTEGGNLRLDARFGGGDINRTRGYAAELVKLAPDVILVTTGVSRDAVHQETKTIPIVALTGDLNQIGVVHNVARPEGNITGFVYAFGSLGGRWLDLLKEAAPDITRILNLRRQDASGSYIPYVEVAAHTLGVKVEIATVRNAGEIEAAIKGFSTEPNGGLLPDPGMLPYGFDVLIRMAEQYRLPAIYPASSYAADGGLMSYGSDPIERVRGAASYIDRILRGAKIADLPVQYPTRFRLVINLKAAKAIGLTVPPTLIGRADEVIE